MTNGSSESTLQTIENILRSKFELQGPITAETKLISDLQFDSLQLYELVVELEEAFHVSIPSDQLASVNTVGEAANLVKTLQSTSPSNNSSS